MKKRTDVQHSYPHICPQSHHKTLPASVQCSAIAEPEKLLNTMDDLTIIVSDLVKQPCDSDYKFMKISFNYQ